MTQPAVQPPATPVLLAALEGMALLIYREYGTGPIAPDVKTYTDATPEQVAAVNEVERWWEAVKPEGTWPPERGWY